MDRTSRAFRRLGYLMLMASSWLLSCKAQERFPALDAKIAGPADIATSPSGKLFYVLNSDFERKFNKGSILVIDPEKPQGEQKLAVVSTKRLGRTMSVGQNLLLITYDSSSEAEKGFVELWSVSDEASPTLLSEFSISCSPINGIVAPTQPYFAVACSNGDLHVGTFGAGGANATLDRVRSYGVEHRAMYFYEGSGGQTWLFGFPSDSDVPEYDDFDAQDKQYYAQAEDKMLDGPNGVPDVFEDSLQVRRRLSRTLPYRMTLYNLSEELSASAAGAGVEHSKLRYVELGTYSSPTQANNELLYVTFQVKEGNGQQGGTGGTIDIYSHTYRTNFWEVKTPLGAEGGDVFYISQRGNRPGSSSNQILRFVLNADVLPKFGKEALSFTDLFRVDRVYGFGVDRDSIGRFPGDFEYATVGGEPMLIINHFRDLINFPSASFYSVTRKLLGSSSAGERPSSIDSVESQASYFQVAVSANGKVLTASFYGDGLYLFDADPSISILSQSLVRLE